MTESAPTIPYDSAARVIEQIMRGQLLNQKTLLNGNVTISKGFEGAISDPKFQSDILSISFESAQVVSNPDMVSEAMRKAMLQLPQLKDYDQLEKHEEYTARIKSQIEGMRTDGVNIPAELLQWKGFAPEISRNSVEDYALRFSVEEKGIHASMHIPVNPNAHEDNTQIAQAVAQNLRERMPQIKATLLERAGKYATLSEQDKQTILNLDADVTTFSNNDMTHVSVTFRSPQQLAASRAAGPLKEDGKTLLESNPLSRIPNAQLGKVLGRSLLHSDPRGIEILPLVGGREDVKSALKFAIGDYAKKNPGKDVSGMQKILSEDIFRPMRQWNLTPKETERGKYPAKITVDPANPNRLEFKLSLPVGKAEEVTRAIAALAPAQEASGLIFDKINTIQLIGANTAQAYQQAQSIFNQPDPKADNLWQNLTPLAQDLVQYVEQAHNAIENAVTLAAQAEAQKQASSGTPSTGLKNVTMVSPSATHPTQEFNRL